MSLDYMNIFGKSSKRTSGILLFLGKIVEPVWEEG